MYYYAKCVLNECENTMQKKKNRLVNQAYD